MSEPKPVKYRLARLYKPSSNAKDQRWEIRYYSTDSAGMYGVRREKDFNAIYPDEQQRQTYCDDRIKYINNQLRKHAIESKEEPRITPKRQEPESIQLIKALDDAVIKKKGIRRKTRKNYSDYKNRFTKWLREFNYTDLTTDKLTKTIVDGFIDQLFVDGLKNRTINNHIHHLRTVLSWIKMPNPFLDVEVYETEIGRNWAFPKEMRETMIKHMVNIGAEGLLLACEHMFYTLMRPNEMSLIKVEDVGYFHSDQIAFNAEISKNKVYRNVTLPIQYEKRLKKWLQSHNAQPSDYVFGRGFQPGAKWYPPEQMAESFRTRVRDRLSISNNYTFYSWKHSGVVELYLSGVNSAFIRMQLGHISTAAFEDYLKSLGLFKNPEVRNNYPTV